MENKYSNLLGLTKKELTAVMGDDFNFYPDDIWTYWLQRSFWGRKTVLIVWFENNVVIKTNIKKTYGHFDKTHL